VLKRFSIRGKGSAINLTITIFGKLFFARERQGSLSQITGAQKYNIESHFKSKH
jgi:hypothetical protein